MSNRICAIIRGENCGLITAMTDEQISEPNFVSKYDHKTIPSPEDLEKDQKEFTWPHDFYINYLKPLKKELEIGDQSENSVQEEKSEGKT